MILDLNDRQRDSLALAVAYGLAVFEHAPAHWLRNGALEDARSLFEKVAPPPKRQGKPSPVLPVAKRNVAKLLGGAS